MTKSTLLVGILALGATVAVGCSGSAGTGSSGNGGSGGAASSGGATSKGDTSGTGGSTTSGGTSGSGGVSASGGISGGGGMTTSGGSGGSGGTTASSGGSGSGGKSGSGGASATGGVVGTGGGSTSGGSSGSGGGTNATGGSKTPDGGPGTGGVGAGGTGTAGTGGGGSGGAATGGTSGTAGTSGGLPPLKVNGTKLQDPNGKTIVLRGSSLIDIGELYVEASNNVKGITDRMDKLAAAGVQGHTVRFPVYPKIDYNGGGPYCSNLPYPVGSGPTTSCTAKSPMTAPDYVSKVLKPAVDYATSKNLYVIIDHHQIDDASKRTSADDAKTFWADIAPKFASYGNVFFEVFNEPIDGSATWAALKPKVQGWIDTIRSGGASNVIIVPSNSYCQRPGDAASDPPTDPKANLMYTAHIYPGNWNAAFKQQIATAVTKAPVFITEWGYILNSSDSVAGTSSATWGSDLQTLVDANGASWTAWITDNSWTPNMFTDSALTKLSEFGTLAKNWLAAKATSDWVQ